MAAAAARAIVLVDHQDRLGRAPGGALPQTRRHALLAALRVPSIVFAVNKIDALAQPQAAFEAVRDALQALPATPASTWRHRAGVGAARRQRHAAARCALVPCRRCCSSCELPATQERGRRALLPVQYVARTSSEASGEQPDGTGHQPRTLWGASPRPCAARRLGAAVPQRRARNRGGAAPPQRRGAGRGRPVGGLDPRPPADVAR